MRAVAMEAPVRNLSGDIRSRSRPAWLAQELPFALFLAFNGLMAWLAWSLTTDVRHWRHLIAAGEHTRVPLREPATSEIILAGIPQLWLVGAVLLGLLAAYWHARFAADTAARGRRPAVG